MLTMSNPIRVKRVAMKSCRTSLSPYDFIALVDESNKRSQRLVLQQYIDEAGQWGQY